ncbi:hypothetical protein Q9189_001916 [Teloschistes chrysophthalmus]
MPQAASWAGTPSIKGSTESVRMALLTYSLVGLQRVVDVELIRHLQIAPLISYNWASRKAKHRWYGLPAPFQDLSWDPSSGCWPITPDQSMEEEDPS